jgi:aldose 1-epimerase
MTSPTVPAAAPFELRAGDLRLAVRPDVGGSLAGLWWRDKPVMRSADPQTLNDTREAASFPLVPYSNRIAHRQFDWRGQAVTLDEASANGGPHAIHGVGVLRPWRVVSQAASAAEWGLSHAADGLWPFSFEATQRAELTADTLSLQFTIVNTGHVPQPVGLGWHPYFPLRSRSHLRAQVGARWDNDTIMLPVARVPVAGLDADVATQTLDNCFEGWDGQAEIDDECFSLRLRSSLRHLVVYTPPGRDFFCVEPVSHRNDAFHTADPAAHGLRTLQPGERFDASFTLDVSPK